MRGDRSGIKIDISRSQLGIGDYAVVLYREIEAEAYEVVHFDEKGQKVFTHYKTGEMFSGPTLTLDLSELKALGDAIAEIGIKTDSDMKREGLLEATKYHLEDFRKLVFRETGNAEKG